MTRPGIAQGQEPSLATERTPASSRARATRSDTSQSPRYAFGSTSSMSGELRTSSRR